MAHHQDGSSIQQHTENCVAEGEYVVALRGILATDDFDQGFCDALPWGLIENFGSDCLDRPAAMPAGSFYDNGMGGQQRHCYAND
jgi:hypothetical protein